MIRPPLILITNDDGIDSPGLHAAAEALLPLGELLIAAPDKQQSASGGSHRAARDAAFIPKELNIAGRTIRAWSLDATPASTVKHALNCLTPRREPDLAVSGINFGENLGTNVFVSGTVGAALEAAVWDLKAMAVSLEVHPGFHYNHGEVEWSGAVEILRSAAERLLNTRWPDDVHVMKLDIPKGADKHTPWHISTQSREPGWYSEVPQGLPSSTIGNSVSMRGPRPDKNWKGNDDMGILMGRREVALTPLSIDLTSRCPKEDVAALMGIKR